MRNGEIVVAIQEERLTGFKRARIHPDRPSLAVPYCLDYAGIRAEDLNLVVDSTLRDDCPVHNRIPWNPVLLPVPQKSISHHFAHAISAFATSGLSESAILVIDGSGSGWNEIDPSERNVIQNPDGKHGVEIISLYEGRGNTIKCLRKWMGAELWKRNRNEMPPFFSLGSLFSSTSQFIFGEYEAGKVMALAAYGLPVYPPELFFRIRRTEIAFVREIVDRLPLMRVWPSRKKEHENLASSAQAALESALHWIVNHLKSMTQSKNVCYAGGVALNSLANERIFSKSGFERVYIMPAAEDSGPAIGAAYYGYWLITGKSTKTRLMHDEMGKTYCRSEIKNAIETVPGIRALRSKNYIDQTTDMLVQGDIIGWFQGGSELGPRALGQRSILCDPRRTDAKDTLNRRIKFREPFQPFAPSILLEHVPDWFESSDSNWESPFMLRVLKFREDKRQLVPAVVHKDGTGRLQTLTRERNGNFYDLVLAFYRRTGVPILLNTSFNVREEPIVETPEDALWCLLSTGLNACVFPELIVRKQETFRSVLDFIPVVRFQEWSLCTPFQKGKGGSQIPKNAYLEVKTETRWGHTKSKLQPHLLELFSLMDGKRNARKIYHLFQKRGYPTNRQRFVMLLGALRRWGCIDLTSKDNG
jgi:carbamoyltransferase